MSKYTNLDDAAHAFAASNFFNDQRRAAAIQGFKAGAKWVAGQEVEAYCVESSNPVSENPKQRLHCITIVYEEKEDTPYVLGGDKVIVQIRKK